MPANGGMGDELRDALWHTCWRVLARKCLSGNWKTRPVLESLSVGDDTVLFIPLPAHDRMRNFI